MHLDFDDTLNLISTLRLIGTLVFTGMQVHSESLECCEWLAME